MFGAFKGHINFKGLKNHQNLSAKTLIKSCRDLDPGLAEKQKILQDGAPQL